MITATIKEQDLTFQTSKDVFSPDGIDPGTLSMLSFVDFREGDKVLDLGCGYGVVGILAAKFVGPENVVMIDIEQKAVELAKENIERNGVQGIMVMESDGLKDMRESNFSLILSNPPYHVDFSVPKHFIEKSFNRLRMGGRMYMVTKRKEWYKNRLIAIFGGVKIWEENGYYIFMSEKNTTSYANNKKK
ncbi:MAG: methyltransferase [Gorillibacterium sp.]|nr:methyltransferase [Gorillibacterium sp.]